MFKKKKIRYINFLYIENILKFFYFLYLFNIENYFNSYIIINLILQKIKTC